VRETASEDLHPVAAKHFVNSGVNLEAWGEHGVADPEQSGPSDGLLRVGLALIFRESGRTAGRTGPEFLRPSGVRCHDRGDLTQDLPAQPMS
jgi:hypothetical protein